MTVKFIPKSNESIAADGKEQPPFHHQVLFMSRKKKRLVMMALDAVALVIALWGGFALRLAEWWPSSYLNEAAWIFLVVPLVGVQVFRYVGLYRIVTRYMGVDAIWVVAKSVFFLAALVLFFDEVLSFPLLPRSVPIGFALLALFLVGGSRFIFKQYYLWLQKHYVEKAVVLIYGAGAAGVRLSLALAGDSEYYPYAFLDDDSALWGGTVKGLKVFPPAKISELVDKHQVSHILLAMPSVEQSRKKQILDQLEGLPVHVQTLPTMDEIVAGQVEAGQLRDVELEELLGRDPVPPRKELFNISIDNKVVMVTGAGGSIGSELCRQVITATPRALVLYELSEFALYQVEQSLRGVMSDNGIDIPLFPLLGSVCDENRVSDIIQRFNVQTIYHAAAYKHVPIVEHNVLQGIANNVLGTHVVARLAEQHSVERFVLVSTDKAVRPTNVMGATKRLAELVLQDLAANGAKTIFSMVRFGNVLGSSGSVVPLFRRQIASGGPVTVTHQDITRFFMTIPEAASLVVQAGSMGEGGDVFVLDMGEPVKIADLARRMIHLTGLEVREDRESLSGIEIAFTGLRPGEKLYEELLIGDNVIETLHPKIMRAHEELLPAKQLEELLLLLENAVVEGNSHQGRLLLQQNVSGFHPTSELVDLLRSEITLH